MAIQENLTDSKNENVKISKHETMEQMIVDSVSLYYKRLFKALKKHGAKKMDKTELVYDYGTSLQTKIYFDDLDLSIGLKISNRISDFDFDFIVDMKNGKNYWQTKEGSNVELGDLVTSSEKILAHYRDDSNLVDI